MESCPDCHGTGKAPPPQQVEDDERGEKIARLFHETYERLAPSFGYETRKESAVPWEQVPEQNRALMKAVAATVEDALAGEVRNLVFTEIIPPRASTPPLIEGGADWNYINAGQAIGAALLLGGMTEEQAKETMDTFARGPHPAPIEEVGEERT